MSHFHQELFLLLSLVIFAEVNGFIAKNYCPSDGSHVPEAICGEPICAIFFRGSRCKGDFYLVPVGSKYANFSDKQYYTSDVFRDGSGWKNGIEPKPSFCSNASSNSWGGRSDSVVVRKGCTLELFSRRNFLGRNQTLNYTSSPGIGVWRRQFGMKSLICNCKFEPTQCTEIEKGLKKVFSCEGDGELTCKHDFKSGIYKGGRFINGSEENFRVGATFENSVKYSALDAVSLILDENGENNDNEWNLMEENTHTMTVKKETTQLRVDIYQYIARCGDLTWKFPIVKSTSINETVN